MSVTVELSASTDDVPLEGVFGEAPDARIDFESLVQSNGQSSLSVRRGDPERVRNALVGDPYVHGVRVEDTYADSALFGVEWASTANEEGLFGVLADHDVAILRQTGTNRGWQFRLRFPDADATQAFQGACHEVGIHLEVTRVNETRETGGIASELTTAQREVFTAALERGYFAIPRETTLVELAAEFGVSDQAVSERLRRAQTKIGRAALRSEGFRRSRT